MDNRRLALVMAAIILAVPWVLFFNINQGYWWDEAVYLGLSRNILEGQGYWINVPGQEAFRPPLFSHLIAGIWSVAGMSEPLVKVLSPVFGLLSVLLIFFWARRLYGKEIALWSAFLLLTSHFFMFYGQKLLTETIFVFFSLAGLWLLWTGYEDKKKWHLPLAGLLFGLAFLTRYPGIILMAVFVLYPVIRNLGKKGTKRHWEKKLITGVVSTARNWGFWVGLAVFLVLLAPWFQHNMAVFGSPTGAMSVGMGTVTSGWYLGGWEYYFTHWTEVFGFVGLFALPGIIYLVLNRSEQNNLLLLLVILTIGFFIYIPRKESRYLIHFFQVYVVLIGLGIRQFRKWVRSEMVIPVIAVVLLLFNFSAGIQMVYSDMWGGVSLKQAGLWVGEQAPEGTAIMSNNIPPIFYTTGKHIVYFPQERDKLWETVNSQSVSYLVIEAREPSYPEWLWVVEGDDKFPSGVLEEDGFEMVNTFQEIDWWGHDITLVWVYKAGDRQ